MPITLEVLKGFFLTRIMPPLIAALTTWILGTHVLDLFGFTHDELAKGISELVTWGVTALIAFAGAHHALKGNYTPGKVQTVDGPEAPLNLGGQMLPQPPEAKAPVGGE